MHESITTLRPAETRVYDCLLKAGSDKVKCASSERVKTKTVAAPASSNDAEHDLPDDDPGDLFMSDDDTTVAVRL